MSNPRFIEVRGVGTAVIKRVTTERTANKLVQWIKEYNNLDVSPDKILSSPHYVLVTIDGSPRILGGVGLGRSNFFSKELFHLFVRTEYRHKGIGRLLVEYCLKEAVMDTKPLLFCTVREENTASLACFWSLGFTNWAEYTPLNESYKVIVLVKTTGYGTFMIQT